MTPQRCSPARSRRRHRRRGDRLLDLHRTTTWPRGSTTPSSSQTTLDRARDSTKRGVAEPERRIDAQRRPGRAAELSDWIRQSVRRAGATWSTRYAAGDGSLRVAVHSRCRSRSPTWATADAAVERINAGELVGRRGRIGRVPDAGSGAARVRPARSPPCPRDRSRSSPPSRRSTRSRAPQDGSLELHDPPSARSAMRSSPSSWTSSIGAEDRRLTTAGRSRVRPARASGAAVRRLPERRRALPSIALGHRPTFDDRAGVSVRADRLSVARWVSR